MRITINIVIVDKRGNLGKIERGEKERVGGWTDADEVVWIREIWMMIRIVMIMKRQTYRRL